MRLSDEGVKVMFLLLFGVLVIAWLLGYVIFHVAGGLIHLLMVLALIFLVLHLLRGGTARA
jgi:hypothetical protein